MYYAIVFLFLSASKAELLVIFEFKATDPCVLVVVALSYCVVE